MITSIEYRVGAKGVSRPNIIWGDERGQVGVTRFPMNGGRWHRDHPCRDNPEPMGFWDAADEQPKSDDALGRFRALGYVASCFPEGDGITFDAPDGKTPEQVAADITACFGWKVRIRR